MTQQQAVLAVSGRASVVTRWAATGLIPVWLGSGSQWSLLKPAEPNPAQPDLVTLLGGRPIPNRLRPAVLVVAESTRVLLGAYPKGAGSGRRWLVWVRGVGVVRPSQLPSTSGVGLLQLAGIRDDRSAKLRELLAGDHRSGEVMADQLCQILALPSPGFSGAEPSSPTPSRKITPDAKVLARLAATRGEQLLENHE